MTPLTFIDVLNANHIQTFFTLPIAVAHVARPNSSLITLGPVPVFMIASHEVHMPFVPSNNITFQLHAAGSWSDSNINWASPLTRVILFFTNATHSAHPLFCEKLLGSMVPLVCLFSGFSSLVLTNMGLEIFSHQDDDTPLLLPLTRLKLTAWDLMRYY